MKVSVKKGDQVYLPELKQFGTVEEITESGRPKTVRIQTPDGDKIINVLNMIVKIGKVILMAWPVFEELYLRIKRWFQ